MKKPLGQFAFLFYQYNSFYVKITQCGFKAYCCISSYPSFCTDGAVPGMGRGNKKRQEASTFMENVVLIWRTKCCKGLFWGFVFEVVREIIEIWEMFRAD